MIRGSVLAIPIGDRLLYVEPIYLQAEHRFEEAALELEQMRALLEQLSGQVDEGDRADASVPGGEVAETGDERHAVWAKAWGRTPQALFRHAPALHWRLRKLVYGARADDPAAREAGVVKIIDRLVGRDVGIEGQLHPRFAPVAKVLERLLRQYEGGAAVCVYHHGECVVDLWGGVRDSEGRPWRRETMAASFSTTKGIASTLVHIMVDRGLLDYDARVAEYWPEFGQAGKEEITLRQVLSHQSGLYHIRQMIDVAERMLDWDHMVRAIERATPIHPPGQRTGYHGLTYGFLVGEILQRVTGQSFQQLVQTELVEPLSLDGMYVGAPEEALGRAAELMWIGSSVGRSPEVADRMRRLEESALGGARRLRDLLNRFGVDLDLESILDALAPRGISGFDFGALDTLRAAIPAANGLFTARSLAGMYAALAGGGELNGVRLLSRRTLAEATQRQRPALGLAVIPFDMRWRLGYHGIFTTAGFSSQAFGHFGFGGSGGWADPGRDLAVAFIVNRGMGTPFGDTRTARISGAALCCARAADTAARREARASADRAVPEPA